MFYSTNVTDHAITLNHVIDWDQDKVIDRESNKTDRWIKEAVHVRNQEDKSMNRNDGFATFSNLRQTACRDIYKSTNSQNVSSYTHTNFHLVTQDYVRSPKSELLQVAEAGHCARH